MAFGFWLCTIVDDDETTSCVIVVVIVYIPAMTVEEMYETKQ